MEPLNITLVITAILTLSGTAYSIYSGRKKTDADAYDVLSGIVTRQAKQIEEMGNRIREIERTHSTVLATLEEYHRGTVANAHVMRSKGITPAWEPVGLSWRGTLSAKDDE